MKSAIGTAHFHPFANHRKALSLLWERQAGLTHYRFLLWQTTKDSTMQDFSGFSLSAVCQGCSGETKAMHALTASPRRAGTYMIQHAHRPSKAMFCLSQWMDRNRYGLGRRVVCRWVVCVARRKAPTRRNTEDREHLQSNNSQWAQLTDQAPGTIERAAQESRGLCDGLFTGM